MPVPSPVLLMVRSLGIGGSERQAAETARFLDRSQFQPHVACFRPEGMRARDLETAGVPVLHLPVTSFRNSSVLRGVAMLRQYLRQHDIRIVHAFDVPMNVFGIPAASFSGPRVLLGSQRAHRNLAPPASRLMLRAVDRIVDGIVVNCEAMRKHLEVDEGVPSARIHVCYNGIDTALYSPSAVERPAPLTGGPVVGIACALRPEKGLMTLLKAFATVHREFPAARLAIVGSGPEGPALKAAASELGIAAFTHFEPETHNVVFWLRCFDIFVLPSLSEALSNSLMEAMACGCCPVASSVGGNPELVLPDRTGLLFEPGDADGLAARLRTLLQNEPERRRLAEAAASCIAERFSHRAAAVRMGQIYEERLHAKRG